LPQWCGLEEGRSAKPACPEASRTVSAFPEFTGAVSENVRLFRDAPQVRGDACRHTGLNVRLPPDVAAEALKLGSANSAPMPQCP